MSLTLMQSIRNMQKARPIERKVITIKLKEVNIIFTRSMAEIVKKSVKRSPM